MVDMVPLSTIRRKVKPSPGALNALTLRLQGWGGSPQVPPPLPPLADLKAMGNRYSIRSLGYLPKPDRSGPWLSDFRTGARLHEPTIHAAATPWTCPEPAMLAVPRRLRWSYGSMPPLGASHPPYAHRYLPARQYRNPSCSAVEGIVLHRQRVVAGSVGSTREAQEKKVRHVKWRVRSRAYSIGREELLYSVSVGPGQVDEGW